MYHLADSMTKLSHNEKHNNAGGESIQCTTVLGKRVEVDICLYAKG